MGECYLFLKPGTIFYNYSTAQYGLTSHVSRVHRSHVISGCLIGQYSSSREKTFIHHPRVRKTANKYNAIKGKREWEGVFTANLKRLGMFSEKRFRPRTINKHVLHLQNREARGERENFQGQVSNMWRLRLWVNFTPGKHMQQLWRLVLSNRWMLKT